jgi:hypothetical protein
MPTQKVEFINCLECGTRLGAGSSRDAYSHLLHCLHVEPNALHVIREQCAQEPGEHSNRVLHIVDFLSPEAVEA